MLIRQLLPVARCPSCFEYRKEGFRVGFEMAAVFLRRVE
jgi:hypothetical protein